MKMRHRTNRKKERIDGFLRQATLTADHVVYAWMKASRGMQQKDEVG